MDNVNTSRHFYGRRKGKFLRDGRVQSLAQIQGTYLIEETILEKETITMADIFDKEYREHWLEIGFGSGEYMIGQAQNNPDIGMIGCEAFINGVSAAARDVAEKDVRNMRFWNEDALPLMQKIEDGSLDRIFLLFPDPWPKTRHYKRRFIQDHTIDLFVRKLKVGGMVRLATDDNPLAQWMLLHAVQNDKLAWQDWQSADWKKAPSDWIETRYQQKAAQQGRLGHFMDFVKKS